MFVMPSRCTVFIQNSLLVDWFGLTVFIASAGGGDNGDVAVLVLFTAAVLLYSSTCFVTEPDGSTCCAIAFCMFWLMPIIIAAVSVDATMIATAISSVCLVVFVDILF
jgi:hypothetical protein